jgi:hypothetical protein
MYEWKNVTVSMRLSEGEVSEYIQKLWKRADEILKHRLYDCTSECDDPLFHGVKDYDYGAGAVAFQPIEVCE